MFQLAACPRCETLQLHRDLGEVEARECRRCEEPVPSDDWDVREEHGAFVDARDRLRRLRDRPAGPGGFSSGPPVPEARLPLQGANPGTRRDLRRLLEEWARRSDPVPEDEVVDGLTDAGVAHLLRHLVREGLVEPVEGSGGGAAYRVRADALPDPGAGPDAGSGG